MTDTYEQPGYHNVKVDSEFIYIPNNYTYIGRICLGSCSQVHCVIEKENKKKVAIKKLVCPFVDEFSAKRTYREIKLLKHVKHDNIIELLDLYTPDNTLHTFDNVYLVTPFLDMNLAQLIKTGERITDDQLEILICQLFKGLEYLHSSAIIHRDLKPSNIAINADFDLKILDFGLARHVDSTMTGYVTTCWYRAPEVITNWKHYSVSIDIWSLGCIVAELMTGNVLLPGSDYLNQVQLCLKLVGTPSIESLKEMACPEAIAYIQQTVPSARRICFHEKFHGRDSLLINLLELMLEFIPRRRISAEEALKHDYLKKYHPSTCCANEFDHNFEENSLKVSDWKNLVWQEIK